MVFSRLRTSKFFGFVALGAITPLLFGPVSVQAEDLETGETTVPESVPTDAVPQSVSAPADINAMVTQMDQAANAQRLKTFMGYFDKSFVHEDGLDRQQLKQSVRSFWKQFDQLTYSTALNDWEEVSPGTYETVTTTTVKGQKGLADQQDVSRTKKLTATIQSKQKIQNGKIVSQQVLDEQSQIVSGENPPDVQVNLPKTVNVGQDYFFDVIVDQPLGDRILLGAAIEENVSAQGYLAPSQFEIQPLATGGLFKIGKSPDKPQDQWISALLIQDGGMYMMSQRVFVVPSETPTGQPEKPQTQTEDTPVQDAVQDQTIPPQPQEIPLPTPTP